MKVPNPKDIAGQIVGQITGTPSQAPASGGRLGAAQLSTENRDVQVADGMWDMAKIDGTRWNKQYPYELIMVEAKNGSYISTPYKFVLPIPPTDLTLTMPFAINSQVTLGGMVEEHNGAPIRGISFSGTFGVIPLRGSGNRPQDNSNKILPSVLAGTISAVNGVVNNAKAIASGKLPFAPGNLHAEDEFASGGPMEKATGYYQFRLLQHFLESYANLKKTEKGKNIRLALAIWKDQAVYLVTPQQFEVRRSAASPWEYNYSFNLKGWKRVRLDVTRSAILHVPASTRDPNMLAQVLNRVQAARATMESLKNTIGAVRSDIYNVLSIAREVAFFCKDALGVAIAASDLPAQIRSDFKNSVLASWESVGADYELLKGKLSDAAVRGGQISSGSNNLASRGNALDADPISKIFQNPDDNFEFFSKLEPGKLNLAPEVNAKIVRERQRIRLLQRLDFEKMRDAVKRFQADFEFDIGLGDETYRDTYNRTDLEAKKQQPSGDDHEAMYALNNMVQELNRLAAAGTQDLTKLSPLEYVAGLAQRAGIAFQIPKSKYPVPFPYGFTLERLAAIYLGDPNRWHEIAVLNGLREPYVDEEGFEVAVVAVGNGLEITVASEENLYIGQPVTIYSTSAAPTKRNITSIEKLADGIVVLNVDGDPDMDDYSPLSSAKMHAFLPNTVNSQMTIYIPSDVEVDDDGYGTKEISGLEDDYLLDVGGIDLLLDSSGDLVITPDGDGRLAVGLTNLVQQIKLALSTPRGSLLQHPTYGVTLPLGESTAEISAAEILEQVKDMFKDDPSFTGVQSVQIMKAGPVLRLTLTVGIVGTTQLIPVTVEIKR